MTFRGNFLLLLISFLVFPMSSPSVKANKGEENYLLVDDFGLSPSDSIPEGWTEYQFKKSRHATEYRVIPDATVEGNETNALSDGYVLRAESDCGGSLIAKRFIVDLHQYPVLRWRWKVEEITDGAEGQGDDSGDFPARIYVAVRPKEGFNPIRSVAQELARSVTGVPIPKAALNFVWSSADEPGETLFNQDAKVRNVIVVVESGDANVGRWVDAEVNVLEYYNRFFPGGPAKTDGIGIMTDSDNTETRVVAYYDDVRFCTGETCDPRETGG